MLETAVEQDHVEKSQSTEQIHLEMNFMKIPKGLGPDIKIAKAPPVGIASKRVSSPRGPVRGIRHLTCNETEVEALLSEGEST